MTIARTIMASEVTSFYHFARGCESTDTKERMNNIPQGSSLATINDAVIAHDAALMWHSLAYVNPSDPHTGFSAPLSGLQMGHTHTGLPSLSTHVS